MDEKRVENEKTKLEGNASIYNKREQRTEKQKLSEMSGKQKLSYLKDYYLKKTLIAILCLGLTGSLLYTVLTPKPETILKFAIFENPFLSDDLEMIRTDLTNLLIQDPENQDIFIDTDYFFSSNSGVSQMKLMTRISAGELDLILAPESLFKEQAENATFLPLEDFLTEERKAKYKDRLYYAKTKSEDVVEQTVTYGAEQIYGIRVSELDSYAGITLVADPYVMGIVVSAERPESLFTVLDYLGQAKPKFATSLPKLE